MMSNRWDDLTFSPDEKALAALGSSWAWLLKEPFHPVLFSTLGDMFFRYESEDAIRWLNMGTSEIVQLAETETLFIAMLRTTTCDEWFMPGLIEQLRAAGKLLLPTHCYTYVTLPIFAEGKYEVGNLNPVPAWQHFNLRGEMHKQLRELLDGTNVRIAFD